MPKPLIVGAAICVVLAGLLIGIKAQLGEAADPYRHMTAEEIAARLAAERCGPGHLPPVCRDLLDARRRVRP